MKKAVLPASPKETKPSERDLVLQTVSEATGVHFEVVPPNPAFPQAVDRIEWFMRCRNREEIAQAPYLNVVWKEKGDGIWLESLAVGDTIDWVEIAYGEEQANKSLDLDYSRFDDPSFQQDFNQRFPIVMGRIKEYETVVEGISKRTQVHVQVRRVGSRGMMVFTVAARVDVRKGASAATMKSAITKDVAVLKEAYEEIVKL